jgi:hypothetical protein
MLQLILSIHIQLESFQMRFVIVAKKLDILYLSEVIYSKSQLVSCDFQ